MAVTSAKGYGRDPEGRAVGGRSFGHSSRRVSAPALRIADEAREIYLALATECPQGFGWLTGFHLLFVKLGLNKHQVVSFRAPRDLRTMEGVRWGICLVGWGPRDTREVNEADLAGLQQLSQLELDDTTLDTKLGDVDKAVQARLRTPKGKSHRITVSGLEQWQAEHVQQLALSSDLKGCPSTHARRRARTQHPATLLVRVLSPLLLERVDQRDARRWERLAQFAEKLETFCAEHTIGSVRDLLLADTLDPAVQAALQDLVRGLLPAPDEPVIWQEVQSARWSALQAGAAEASSSESVAAAFATRAAGRRS